MVLARVQEGRVTISIQVPLADVPAWEALGFVVAFTMPGGCP